MHCLDIPEKSVLSTVLLCQFTTSWCGPLFSGQILIVITCVKVTFLNGATCFVRVTFKQVWVAFSVVYVTGNIWMRTYFIRIMWACMCIVVLDHTLTDNINIHYLIKLDHLSIIKQPN